MVNRQPPETAVPAAQGASPATSSPTRRGTSIAAAAALAVCLSPCVACSSGPQSTQHAVVRVTPVDGTRVAGETFEVSGLAPHESATLSLQATDARHLEWASSATFTASATGTIDTAHTVSTGGSYQGTVPMGLMSHLHPLKRTTQADWFAWPAGQQRFTVAVSTNGQTVGSGSFTRAFFAAGTTEVTTTLANQGFVGRYYHPSQPSPGLRPAVLTFGGSEGGNDTYPDGNQFAALGYPSLSIAYFKAPGLSPYLNSIPIEYFAKALRWLGAQPGVDPHRMYVMGSSRGTEAAQLVAIHFPNLVHGVILGSPSNRANITIGGSGPSAWTVGGKPVPTEPNFGANASSVGPAVFPDERIRGPILMVCGGLDAEWYACPFAHAIINRLRIHHSPYRDVLLEYPNAGHNVCSFDPLDPTWIPAGVPDSVVTGKGPLSSTVVQYAIWRHVLAFIRSTS